MRPRTASDRDVACPATRQHGLITRARMRDLGFGDRAISRRLAAGRLIAVHRGVSAVGHGALTQPARWLAAVLACGPGALLSHGSTAATLWGLAPDAPARIHVTRSGDGGATAPRGVCLHRYTTLAGGDRTRRERIPVTSVTRTLLDLAAVVPRRKLRRAIAQADVLRRLRVEELERMLAAHPGRPGTPLLAGLLAEHRPQGGISRSDFEDRLVELCERYGLPAPRHQRADRRAGGRRQLAAVARRGRGRQLLVSPHARGLRGRPCARRDPHRGRPHRPPFHRAPVAPRARDGRRRAAPVAGGSWTHGVLNAPAIGVQRKLDI